MAIKLLSPQLANQIAAGEVVERPASVVKELVENSLDAGADKIQIDIENGGAGLIRIRDNGCGIAKDELALALARHATSKISDLDDLENILSFGFRGEALASISAVSRLTLTSRTAEQSEAWQVYTQGRDMEATVKPASHPVGSCVEVANLFFNTPARRKFLRADKTEFNHIDEVVRRIALAKFTTAFTLTHNGKTVRQYRAAATVEQQLKRIAAICGDDFVRHALRLDWKHGDLHLSGWVATPDFNRNQNDLAYCYINGRMVRDKVITHAIRQAYAERLPADRYPAFVLFIDLNPQEVDVNVHPTKHEVRFHQQRLIHDFICQGISDTLDRHRQPLFSAAEDATTSDNPFSSLSKANRAAAGHNMFAADEPPTEAANFVQTLPKHSENRPHFDHENGQSESFFLSEATRHGGISARQPDRRHSHYRHHVSHTDVPSKTERASYAALLATDPAEAAPIGQCDVNGQTVQYQPSPVQARSPQSPELLQSHHSVAEPTAPYRPAVATDCPPELPTGILRAVGLVEKQALLLQRQSQFYLLSLIGLQRLNFTLQLQKSRVAQQPLLIPVVFRLNDEQFAQWQQKQAWFAQIGVECLADDTKQRLTLNRIPLCLRQQNWQKLLLALLQNGAKTLADFIADVVQHALLTPPDTLADAVSLLGDTERLLPQGDDTLNGLLHLIDWQPYLTQLPLTVTA